MLITGLIKRSYNNVNKRAARFCAPWIVKFWPERVETAYLGKGDGAWRAPVKLLRPGGICYCVGVGQDASFDMALAQLVAKVFSFDPTPRSISYMSKLDYDRARIHFLPVGIWSEDAELKFYAPMNRRHGNYSIKNIHSTSEFFVAKCNTLSSVMKQFGHDHINLIKLDIEGAWYEVISSMFRDGVN